MVISSKSAKPTHPYDDTLTEQEMPVLCTFRGKECGENEHSTCHKQRELVVSEIEHATNQEPRQENQRVLGARYTCCVTLEYADVLGSILSMRYVFKLVAEHQPSGCLRTSLMEKLWIMYLFHSTLGRPVHSQGRCTIWRE